ncbi:putative amid-like NADH oxidoreductase [Microdochium trichocladiopsis]|uniref:Amid-like NADH oxidoreductase n=1 Tax=Microdochium trichocladiopsis TaxID=1682393 RepID=A0A9P9BSA1_9PEZI|nr:putative amid-like NADH oxidoreductase [Microdochium trichocladiopsis]KAH7033538.1 putative amid-like NADH oxidoreductase [Microdochium trichocladiopsis]
MASALRNVVVVGGSYVGLAVTKELVASLPATHRLLLVEPHSHFHHLFAFPRFALLPNHEHKAFIPYSAAFAGSPEASAAHHAVIKAKAVSLRPDHLVLDRPWQGSTEIPFDYLVVATGTKLQAPGTMQDDEKPLSVKYFQAYQGRVAAARSVILVGGGAVGVQMATDLKELYPDKEVTLVHSRNKLMPLYHEALDGLIKSRFEELGVKAVLGTRVAMPPNGFPVDATSITLQDGRVLTADLIIPAVGQTPNNQFVTAGLLDPSTPEESLINPQNGFIRVRPTLQFKDEKYPNLFAVGDIADTGAHKAARPGSAQAAVVAKNVLAMIEGREPRDEIVVDPASIHLTLGLTKNVIFRNPYPDQTEYVMKPKDDGKQDMGINGVWERRGVRVLSDADYHL